MTERTDQLTDDEITQLLRTRSADPDLGLLDDIVRAVGAIPQDRPWLGLRPVPLARRTVLLIAVALLAVTTGAIAVGSGLLPPNPGGVPFEGVPFEGVWISTSDTDGGTQSMTVRVKADGDVEIVVNDDVASECSGTPSTMTGIGRLDGNSRLVIPAPVYTCDDGSEPQALSGPPLDEQLRNLTFVYDAESGLLTVGSAGVWRRPGAPDPSSKADPRVAEATTLVEDFLQARIDGTGAEEYADLYAPDGVPLLYATTTGATYERYEFERVGEPDWPDGNVWYRVRLFADGGETVVEQFLFLKRLDGRLGIDYHGDPPDFAPTTENGQAVPVGFSFFDGEVTGAAAWPWRKYGTQTHAWGLILEDGNLEEGLQLIADPWPVETGCEPGPAPADADALARTVQSDSDFEATAPVAVRVGGIAALRMDVHASSEASVCEAVSPMVLTADRYDSWEGLAMDEGSRIRLYLLDLPEGSATRILAMAIIAPETRFDAVIEAAAPIIESIEFLGR